MLWSLSVDPLEKWPRAEGGFRTSAISLLGIFWKRSGPRVSVCEWNLGVRPRHRATCQVFFTGVASWHHISCTCAAPDRPPSKPEILIKLVLLDKSVRVTVGFPCSQGLSLVATVHSLWLWANQINAKQCLSMTQAPDWLPVALNRHLNCVNVNELCLVETFGKKF